MKRFFVAMTSMVMAMGCLPTIQAKAAQSVSLNIEKVKITSEELSANMTENNRQVSVDVCVEGNEEGFLAAEFGIVYDSRLTLETVVNGTEVGSSFNYMSNPESSFIWFSGANGETGTNTSADRQDMFTLVFTLPEDCAVGDVYYVGYSWDALDGSSAFWNVDKGSDQIEEVIRNSASGSISIPDPSAPELDASTLQMNQGDSIALHVMNSDASCIWYSDHNDIANVDGDGVVTAYAPGTCTINCYVGSSLLSCEVVVTEGYSIAGDSPIVLTTSDNTVTLSYPDPEGMVIWTSTAPDVVQVTDGQVSGLKNGTAQVIASSNGVAYARQIVVEFPEETTPATTNPKLTTEPIVVADPNAADTEETTETTTEEAATEATSASEFQCGDIDHNGAVNIMDVITLNRSLMIGVDIDETLADVVQDGQINAVDSLALLKYVVNLVDAIPVV